MLSAADRDEFDVLSVDDLSRLARDQVESERVIRRLEFQGIRIVATADGYDSQTKTATRKIQRTVKRLVNEMRLDELREQVHRGLTGQAIKGYWCGGRVYGEIGSRQRSSVHYGTRCWHPSVWLRWRTRCR
jgi:DNA invertase Pin-like site-specific DNA recombinase